MVSLPARPLTTSVSLAASTPLTVTCAASPLTVTVPLLLVTLMLSSPAVPLTFTVSAAVTMPAAERRQVDGHLRDAGTGQVVDRDGVGTADSREH